MSPPTRVGATTKVVDHGHTKRGDGGVLDFAKLLAGQAPTISPVVRRTGESAAIATTSLVVAPAPGLWRISAYIEITALTVAGTITLTLGWTDAGGATTDATITKAVAGAPDRIKGGIVAEIASGNLTYAVGIGLFAGTYNIRLVPERVVPA